VLSRRRSAPFHTGADAAPLQPPNLRLIGDLPFTRHDREALSAWLAEAGWPRGQMDMPTLEGYLVALLAWPVGVAPGAWLESASENRLTRGVRQVHCARDRVPAGTRSRARCESTELHPHAVETGSRGARTQPSAGCFLGTGFSAGSSTELPGPGLALECGPRCRIAHRALRLFPIRRAAPQQNRGRRLEVLGVDARGGARLARPARRVLIPKH
jgi:hypothetical protein